MPIGLERDYRLRWMDFDRYGRFKPQAILDIFQDIATAQAEEMGISDKDLAPKGVFWVVTRVKIEIVNEPQYHERVIARTWPHTQTKLSFLRDYTIRTEEEELLVKATSEWVLVDAGKRSFASALLAYDGPKDFYDARSFESKPKKIKNFTEEPTKRVTIVPGYSDIDKNGHLNNAMYARLIIDALEPSDTRALKTFQIDYRHEVLAGKALTIEALVEDDAVKVRGLLEDGQTAFMALIETTGI